MAVFNRMDHSDDGSPVMVAEKQLWRIAFHMLFAVSVSSMGTRSKLVVSGAPVKHITIHLFHNLLLLLLFFDRLVSCRWCLVTTHRDRSMLLRIRCAC